MYEDEKRTIYIQSLMDGVKICKALGSEVRIEILQMIRENEDISLDDLAKKLEITKGAVSSHIKILEESGVIESTGGTSRHWNGKKRRICIDRIIINPKKKTDKSK